MKISALPQLNTSCIIDKEFCIEKVENQFYILSLYLHILSLENEIIKFNNIKQMEEFVYSTYTDNDICNNRLIICQRKEIKSFIQNQINNLEKFLIDNNYKYNKEKLHSYLNNMSQHEKTINFLIDNYNYYIGLQLGL